MFYVLDSHYYSKYLQSKSLGNLEYQQRKSRFPRKEAIRHTDRRTFQMLEYKLNNFFSFLNIKLLKSENGKFRKKILLF